MSTNPLNLYINCTRLVFNVEPVEVWEDCEEFERNLRELFNLLKCSFCSKLLIEPVIPKKQHISCQHRVCLDCIGKKRSAHTNCKMCSDYTLFEKSHSTKLLLRCFQELCELVRSCWIYDYIQRRTNHDTGQREMRSVIDIIEAGMNYGQISIVLDETSSDENSSSSETSKDPLQSISYSSQVFPNMSPLSPVKITSGNVQSSPEQFTIISEPLVAAPQIVQYHQSQIPTTSKLTPNLPPPPPIRLTTIAAPMGTKPIMAPMKIQQQTFASPTPTIYSVMYTGTGNKITLKRKPPDDSTLLSPTKMPIIKTDNTMTTASFKRPPMQMSTAPLQPNQSSTGSSVNDQMKRRGCRCGNATAAPGKLTCCGQRCPCYVDSKACIDCKCKGCRNPHYVDGHKKMRHEVPDTTAIQQQQQSFLASIQHQTTIASSSTSVIKTEDFNLMDQTTMLNRAAPSSTANNIFISMNSNGQYQIKQSHPRIIVKDQVKTIGPLLFPPNSSNIHQPVVTTIGNLSSASGNIQILGMYSRASCQMGGTDKKIIIKNDQTAVVSFADAPKPLLERSTAFSENNLNSNLL